MDLCGLREPYEGSILCKEGGVGALEHQHSGTLLGFHKADSMASVPSLRCGPCPSAVAFVSRAAVGKKYQNPGGFKPQKLSFCRSRSPEV